MGAEHRPAGRAPRRRWRRSWRRRGLRARLTLITMLVLAATLGAGGVLTLRLTDRVVLAGSEESARSRLTLFTAVVGRIGIGQAVQPVLLRMPPGQLLMILDSSGRVLVASADLAEQPPILDAGELRRARLGAAVVSDHTSFGPLLSVAKTIRTPSRGRVTVVVSVPVDDNVRSMNRIRTGIAIGVPLLILFLGGTVWVVVGRALRPVVALRQGADEIAGLGGREPGRQLPVPAAHDEIHDLATTLNAMLDRLNAAVARQRAFTADAAHELRSPLANVRTELEVALAHPDRQDWPETARDVLTDIRRLSGLTEDLLALSRLDTVPVPPHGPAHVPGSVPVPSHVPGPGEEPESTCLADVATIVADRFRTARVPVSLGLAAAPEVGVPGYDLDRVLTNLVDNAVRHAASQVDLLVSIEPSRPEAGPEADPPTGLGGGAAAVVAVIDDGPGIAPPDRSRVFERFTRLDDARDRDAGGAGLGLAIVAETVRRYGGQVTLQDAAPTPGTGPGAGAGSGTGLRAVIRLPLRSAGGPPGALALGPPHGTADDARDGSPDG